MKPLVLGIAGGSASGKSTVARAVADRLGERCLHLVHDRYYHPLTDAQPGQPTAHNFDHPTSLDTPLLVAHLDALRAGQGAHVPRYDFTRHARVGELEWVEPRPVILVEGILVLADADLRARFDRSFFVHTADDLRLLRRIRRDQRERGRAVEDILRQYEATVRPMHEKYVAPSQALADVVLDGTAQLDGLVARVLAAVDAHG